MTWARDIVMATREAFVPLADAERAVRMSQYMKNVAPYFGIPAPKRRAAQRAAWSSVGAPEDHAALAAAAGDLFAQPERELAYAACDLMATHRRLCPPTFLRTPTQALLTTRPWWDTVDALGSAVVSPLCRTHSGLRTVIEEWSASGDRWLVRAALQHQRGWHEDTDIQYALDLCARHAADSEFFVQKAIGWSLRDLAAIDHAKVEAFVASHPALTRVATREAERGLKRAGDGL